MSRTISFGSLVARGRGPCGVQPGPARRRVRRGTRRRSRRRRRRRGAFGGGGAHYGGGGGAHYGGSFGGGTTVAAGHTTAVASAECTTAAREAITAAAARPLRWRQSMGLGHYGSGSFVPPRISSGIGSTTTAPPTLRTTASAGRDVSQRHWRRWHLSQPGHSGSIGHGLGAGQIHGLTNGTLGGPANRLAGRTRASTTRFAATRFHNGQAFRPRPPGMATGACGVPASGTGLAIGGTIRLRSRSIRFRPRF